MGAAFEATRVENSQSLMTGTASFRSILPYAENSMLSAAPIAINHPVSWTSLATVSLYRSICVHPTDHHAKLDVPGLCDAYYCGDFHPASAPTTFPALLSNSTTSPPESCASADEHVRAFDGLSCDINRDSRASLSFEVGLHICFCEGLYLQMRSGDVNRTVLHSEPTVDEEMIPLRTLKMNCMSSNRNTKN